MKRGCLIALVIPVVLVLGFVGSCSLRYPTYTIRYRLTVNAVVEGVTHSGSSVVEMRIVTQPQWIAEVPPWYFRATGEATFVDLDEGRNLVGVLWPKPSRSAGYYDQGFPYNYLVFKAFDVPFLVEHARDFTGLQGERRLEQRDWPAFVTFRNVGDPSSVQSVDPKALATILGKDVRIDSVTVAITQEPVTRNLAQKLPWLDTQVRPREYPVVSSPEISQRALIRDDPR
jgi:hypothetical protein